MNALAAAAADPKTGGVGQLQEKTLHRVLKHYFAPDPETHERPVGGFIADAVTEDGVIEIQTGNFWPLKEKIAAFLPCCPVTVVHPVIADKWAVKTNDAGEVLSRRKSPKHENLYRKMADIYTLREFIGDPRFTLCLPEITLTEYRRAAGRKQKLDRVPESLRSITVLRTAADWAALLPDELPEAFTAAEAGKAIPADADSIRCFFNLLVQFGLLKRERAGRCNLYTRTEEGGKL